MIDNLTEAIAHAKEVAKENREMAKKFVYGQNNREACLDCAKDHEQLVAWLTELAERREADKWIKVTYRPMTKEEEIAYKREFGIDYGDTLTEYENRVFTCELPNDKQNILIQTKWGVKQDICDWDDGYCGLEGNGDWDGVIAWRPLPEPYESEATNEANN